MTNFEGLKDLFIVLKIKHTPKKHWMDFVRWGIVESMNELLLDPLKMLLLLQILYLSAIISLLQYIIHFGFFCIYMLFKVGNKFHFWLVWRRWVCKGHLRTFFIWCSLPWSHLGVWVLSKWEPSSSQWAVMVVVCFKVLQLVSLHKWKKMWFHFLWEYVVLLIESTWLCWFYQS